MNPQNLTHIGPPPPRPKRSETWSVHTKVRKPHLDPPARMNFLPLTLLAWPSLQNVALKNYLFAQISDSSATSFRMEPLLKGLLRSFGGSEAYFLELCFGRFPYGNFHTKATSKKFRPPSGVCRPNPPELPRSPSMNFSSRPEVLHGVGADGVGVKFPIFAVNLLLFALVPLGEAEKSEEKGEKCVEKGEKCVKNGGNHSDPIYTNPIKNLPKSGG